jgi:hypothetical protein
MIRFLNLKNQICEGQNDFAFFDTVSGTICSFGEQGEQVFSSVGEFQHAYGKEQGGTTRPLGRFLSLIPKDYFGNESQPSYSGATSSRFVSLTDLIDVIHYTIIKHRGENLVALKELQRLDWLIKGSKELDNYSVEETELWQSIMRQRNG